MYKIYADDKLFYDDVTPEESFKLVNPKLKLSDNLAGSLAFKLPPYNVQYNQIRRLTTSIKVECEGEEIWSGRVITESEDFWKQKTMVCEGELAFLNDTIQPPSEYEGTVIGFVTKLLETHNSQVMSDSSMDKLFYLGEVTVTDPNDYIYRYTNYESTLTCFNEKLINRLGGHIRIRKVNGKRYLDYLAEYPNTNQQVIEFGINMLDYSKSFDMTDLSTIIVPRGERLDESPIEALDAYLTVESVNGGSIYVESSEAIAAFGRIISVVDWPDVTIPDNLLRKAREYLSNYQFDNMILELSAVDMHLLNVNTERIKLLDNIRCKSTPHGMDRYFPVTNIEIPLDSPENTVYTLNSSQKITLTSATSKTNSDLVEQIASLPSKTSIINEAKYNSTEIVKAANNGYITTSLDENGNAYEQLMLDTPSKKTATKAWMWNLNGFAYISGNGQPIFDEDGNIKPGLTINTAMTMDGSIVADRITTGTMAADRIWGGTLTLGGINNQNGQLFVKDANNIVIGTWDKDGITLFDTGKLKTTDKNNTYYTAVERGAVYFGSGGEENGHIVSINNGVSVQGKNDSRINVDNEGISFDVSSKTLNLGGPSTLKIWSTEGVDGSFQFYDQNGNWHSLAFINGICTDCR